MYLQACVNEYRKGVRRQLHIISGDMVEVVLQKTIIICAIVTVIATVTFLCPTYRKKDNTEPLDRLGSGWTTRTFLTAVFSNKFSCQVSAEYKYLFCVLVYVLLVQYEGVSNSYVKKKPEYVFVVFSTL